MKVFLTSAYPFEENEYAPQHLKESYQLDPFKLHQIVEKPDEADIIIFAENHPIEDPYFFDVLKNKTYKKYKHKCYLYHDNYASVTFLPTVTPTLEVKDYNPVFNGPFSYLMQLLPNTFIREHDAAAPKKFLFSFVGAVCTDPIRKKIMNLKHDQCHLFDTSDKRSWELPADEKEKYARSYAEVCFNSKFILCPRGMSPNSYRLYECMEMGIAPVIISDGWVPTIGPRWDNFSIRVPESDIDNIPQILQEKEAEAAIMGQIARQEWLHWFTKDKQFHYLTEACLELHNLRDNISFSVYLKQYMKFLKPFHARALLRYFKNKMVSGMRPATG